MMVDTYAEITTCERCRKPGRLAWPVRFYVAQVCSGSHLALNTENNSSEARMLCASCKKEAVFILSAAWDDLLSRRKWWQIFPR